MVETEEASLEELLKRNEISTTDFMEQSYHCLLISIFEIMTSEMKDLNYKREVKRRYLNSNNKILTTQKIVYEKTKCKLNDWESNKIYEYLYAYFTKNNKRKIYDDTIKLELLDKQHHQCNICKKNIDNKNAELDHIVPWIFVGDELGENNLQVLCTDCNRRKSKNSAYNLKMFLVNK